MSDFVDNWAEVRLARQTEIQRVALNTRLAFDTIQKFIIIIHKQRNEGQKA